MPEKTFDKNLYDFKRRVEGLILLAYVVTLGLVFALPYLKVVDYSLFNAQGVVLGVYFVLAVGAEIYFRRKYPKNSFPIIDRH